ncbi:MAG: hypothetical protein LBH61_00365 [Dysgonamonadaceae bacterium]|nr:hypothetical protein [Dysgonamonadaceae bacterium]
MSEASCNPFSRRHQSGPPRSQALIFFGSFLHQGKKEQSGKPEAAPERKESYTSPMVKAAAPLFHPPLYTQVKKYYYLCHK